MKSRFAAALKYGKTAPWRCARLMIVGQGGGGKSSLANSYRGEDFNRRHDSTIGTQRMDVECRQTLEDAGAAVESMTSSSEEQAWRLYDDEKDTGGMISRAIRNMVTRKKKALEDSLDGEDKDTIAKDMAEAKEALPENPTNLELFHKAEQKMYEINLRTAMSVGKIGTIEGSL